MVHFTVEEENLVCVYYKADRRRTMGRMTAALPDMDGDMQALARQTIRKECVRVLGSQASSETLRSWCDQAAAIL